MRRFKKDEQVPMNIQLVDERTQRPPAIPTVSPERAVSGKKFMQTLNENIYRELERVADGRGVSIQGLIRAIIIPEWVSSQSDNNTVARPSSTGINHSDETVFRRSNIMISSILNGSSNSFRTQRSERP